MCRKREGKKNNCNMKERKRWEQSTVKGQNGRIYRSLAQGGRRHPTSITSACRQTRANMASWEIPMPVRLSSGTMCLTFVSSQGNTCRALTCWDTSLGKSTSSPSWSESLGLDVMQCLYACGVQIVEPTFAFHGSAFVWMYACKDLFIQIFAFIGIHWCTQHIVWNCVCVFMLLLPIEDIFWHQHWPCQDW